MTDNSKTRVVVGMSGGVDSSVTALLMLSAALRISADLSSASAAAVVVTSAPSVASGVSVLVPQAVIDRTSADMIIALKILFFIMLPLSVN